MELRTAFVLAVLVVSACTGASSSGDDAGTTDAGARPDASTSDAGTLPTDAGVPDAALPDATTSPDAAVPDASTGEPDASVDAGPPECPPGVICVDTFPYHHEGDTSLEPPGTLDAYNCAPNTNEGGPEVVFRVDVPADGFLSVAVYDGTGVDVDVHILTDLDAQACLDRGDKHARADVSAGTLWVVADTYVSGGVEQVGAFTVEIGFMEPSRGPCEVEVGEMPRVNDNGDHLAMPATGPMVLEAHLVTQEEPEPYPSTSTEELAEHYALSQSRSGLVMHRTQDWAPLEGGDFYGAGIGSPTLFPVLHEAWYVNMYWTSAARPARGTRMIVRDPSGGSRAVVVAAGYETGPGDLNAIGGTPEETHFYMGTTHRDEMTLGIAVDQTLPFGPRVCLP
ncbi:MAG: hypothetical protein AB2A00_29000 [Myxococcota bacterium]